MTDLRLPPRRTMPPEVRDRLRHTLAGADQPARPRHRAPLAAAAGVVVLAAGAVLVGQFATAPGDGVRAGTTPPAAVAPAPVLLPPGPGTDADLDRCGAVLEASGARGYAPRSAWEPAFSVGTDAATRLVAAKEYGGKPVFCAVAGTTVALSDPSAEPVALATDGGTTDVYGLLLTGDGMLAGVAQGVAALRFDIVPAGGAPRSAEPAVRAELFVAAVGPLAPGDRIEVTGFDAAGAAVLTGEAIYRTRPPGVTGTG